MGRSGLRTRRGGRRHRRSGDRRRDGPLLIAGGGRLPVAALRLAATHLVLALSAVPAFARAAPQDAPPAAPPAEAPAAAPGAEVPAKSPSPPRPPVRDGPEFLAPDLIRRPDGMVVHYYRVNYVAPAVLQQELEIWKSAKAQIGPAGATFTAAPVGLPASKDTPAKSPPIAGVQNVLRIVETEENLPVLLRVLAMVDVPQPQVRVEAKVVELSWDDQLKIGIESSLTRPVGDTFFQSLVASFPNALDALNGATATFRSEDKYVVFDYAVQLAAQGAEASVTSQPEILVGQGETAVIRAGDQEPIVQQSLSGNSVVATTMFKDVGIRLEVQPVLVGRDSVRVRLVAEASRVSDFRITATAQNQQVVNPVISTRSADTVITVPDGETIVIGGLQANADRVVSTGIPLLKDIPILGYAFGSTSTRKQKTELFFWVTLSIERPEESRLVVPKVAE